METTVPPRPGFIRRLIRFTFRLLRWLVTLLLMVTLLRDSTLPLGDQWTAVGVMVGSRQFDYVGWEIGALAAKVDSTLWGVHPFMSEADRSAYVRAYMDDLARAHRLENQVAVVYANPEVADPEAESAALRAERDALRADLAARQTLAEAILEGQVSSVLVDLGFGVAGQLVPPMAMRFTQVPNLLIVSPRDAIRFDVSINLYAQPVDEQAALEARIDEAQNVSSLIVPLGGIALYPAMILETTSVAYALEVFAHEWLHHYLFLFPLGLFYDFAGETRIINETTANLFGREVGRLVLERYYPDLVPPPPAPRDPNAAPPPTPNPGTPPPFNYGAEMHETRVTVDALLAEGRIEEAEAYMEERRQVFVNNGYMIRKLNQAFFAFYGGYQSGTPGEGGSDPIGPAVQAIRDASASIHDWIVVMRSITTRDELLAVRDAMAGSHAD
ncbi:hypothetical protein FBR02_05195 [Anaerolineae bacterium CFX9]|nr:hypothetical protein [Anaerolineae bacterium CFX9]